MEMEDGKKGKVKVEGREWTVTFRNREWKIKGKTMLKRQKRTMLKKEREGDGQGGRKK